MSVFHLFLGLQNNLFPSDIPTSLLCVLIIPSMPATCLAFLVLLFYHPNNI